MMFESGRVAFRVIVTVKVAVAVNAVLFVNEILRPAVLPAGRVIDVELNLTVRPVLPAGLLV